MSEYCENCGGLLIETDYKKWNEYYIIKKDSWQCARCGQTKEKVRKTA
jgi:DNA-directed RNA polymerase subunit M/transcription elongation factor TFIIS